MSDLIIVSFDYSQCIKLIVILCCNSQAVVDGELSVSKGTIDLPLVPDYINRPMQMVDERGKLAITNYEVIEVKNNMTRVHFYPITVRLDLFLLFDTPHINTYQPLFFTIGADSSIAFACSTFSRFGLSYCW